MIRFLRENRYHKDLLVAITDPGQDFVDELTIIYIFDQFHGNICCGSEKEIDDYWKQSDFPRLIKIPSGCVPTKPFFSGNQYVKDNLIVFDRKRSIEIESYLRAEKYSTKAPQTKSSDFLKDIKKRLFNESQSIYFLNTEAYRTFPINCDSPLQILGGVASGFKLNYLFSQYKVQPNTRIVYFDHSKAALEYKQYLHENWDGRDLAAITSAFVNRPRESKIYFKIPSYDSEEFYQEMETLWSKECDKWGGLSEFRSVWQKMNELRHTFVRVNILEDPKPLLDFYRPDRNCLLWWSNIFEYELNSVMYGLNHCHQRYIDWLSHLTQNFPKLICHGSAYMAYRINGLLAESLRQFDYAKIQPGPKNHEEEIIGAETPRS